jgi:hypothetical protein
MRGRKVPLTRRRQRVDRWRAIARKNQHVTEIEGGKPSIEIQPLRGFC